MLIDWFTVVAQVINFVILVWLLKRFLYKPILNAIDERENRISQQISDAEKTISNAKEELETYQQKNKDFEHQRKSMMSEAKDEAQAKRDELIREAKEEIEALRKGFMRSLEQDQQQLNGEIMNRAAAEVLAIARKALKDLASTDLEDHMINVFIDRLRDPGNDERDQLRAALKASPENITVSSVFEVSSTLQEQIKEAIEELVGDKIQIHFKHSPKQISGIELRVHNYKVAWSVDDYLSSLEESVTEILKNNVFSARNKIVLD